MRKYEESKECTGQRCQNPFSKNSVLDNGKIICYVGKRNTNLKSNYNGNKFSKSKLDCRNPLDF